MLDVLVEAGQEQMVSAHFEAWLNYHTKPASPEVKPAEPEPEEEKPRELTPEELRIKANPRAFLPRVSGLIEPGVFQKFMDLEAALRPIPKKQRPHTTYLKVCIDELRIDVFMGTLRTTDRKSGLKRIFVCSQRIDKNWWPPEHSLAYDSQLISFRNAKRENRGQ